MSQDQGQGQGQGQQQVYGHVQAAMPMQAQQPLQVAVPIGGPMISIQHIEIQSKASNVFRLWCCSLGFSITVVVSSLIAAAQTCTNSDYNNNTFSICGNNAALWKTYAPGLAFGGVLIILSVLALRALQCNGCNYNLNIDAYDMKVLRPLLWIALIPFTGILVWSAIYLIPFNYFAVVLFPYFVPCWAGCVVGILGIVQVCCCQRQMDALMLSMKMGGGIPVNNVMLQQPQFVQPQFQQAQYPPQQQYANNGMYQQQYAQPQQQYAQQQYAQPQPYAPQYYGQQQPIPVQSGTDLSN